jgi:energy-coupling factor transporter ATP-binding protein EcfA2
MMAEKQVRKVIGIVGPCGSGKTTLVNSLNVLGIYTRHIAQEHSYVGAMWQKITNPDFLIFLNASYPETIRRRKLDWTMEEYLEQHRRLAHARQNADLYIFTDPLKPAEIVQIVLDFLKEHAIYPEHG